MDFTALIQRLQETLGESLPRMLGALAVLVLGWIVALIVRAAVRKGLGLLEMNRRLASGTEAKLDLERGVSIGAYYVVLVLALIGFLNVLGLGLVSGPLEGFAKKVLDYLPQIIAGVALVLVAWLVATLLRRMTTSALGATRIDERVSEAADVPSVSESAGQALYWITFLVFLPAILGAFGVQGLLEPVQAMVDEALTMLPNIFAALILAFVGWVVARILRSLVVHLMETFGADRLGQRAGLGEGALGRVVGTIVFAAVLVPALIAALHALEIAAVSVPATRMLEEILGALPNVIAAGLILVIAWFGARLLADILREVLSGLGFDHVPEKLGFREVQESETRPSRFAASLAVAFVMLFALAEAGSLLGFSQVTKLVSTLIEFGGQVVLGVAIIAVGLWIANLAHGAIQRLDSRHAGLVAAIARFAILGLVFAMGLRSMGIADDIVDLAFGLTLGAIAVATALSFGLGGREAAGRQLEHWFSTMRGSGGGSGRGEGGSVERS